MTNLMRLTDITDRPSAGVTCFPAQCSAAVNQRETVAIGQTREKSRIELPIVRSNRYNAQPERLGALDHRLVEAEYALRAQTCGNGEVKRIARP